MRDVLQQPGLLLAHPEASALAQRAGVHQDVLTQRVGVACGKSHGDARGERHLRGELGRPIRSSVSVLKKEAHLLC